MTTSFITSYYHNNVLLGTETTTGITEITFPDTNFFNNPITITKRFDGMQEHRWKVENVLHLSNTHLRLELSPRSSCNTEIFLKQTYKKKNGIGVIGNLEKGRLVEVDFGYIQSTRSSNGVSKSIKRYPDYIQEGEMHKRRLAIVIKATPSRVQVVPVSSKVQNLANASIFQLDWDSIKDLTDYNNRSKNSYAICDMIETVSLSRVLPPISKVKKSHIFFRNTKYPYKLNRVDMKKLEISLSSSIGLSDYQSDKQNLKDFYAEKKLLEGKLKLLEGELASLEGEQKTLQGKLQLFDAMECKLEDFYKSIYPDKSTSDIKEMLHQEFLAYHEILNA